MTNLKGRWCILWPDKTTLCADSATALIDRIAALQWDPCDHAQMRARLTDRAVVWTGITVAEDTDDAIFLMDLASAGMFALYTPVTKGV